MTGQGQNSTIWQVDMSIVRISGEPINKQADVKIAMTQAIQVFWAIMYPYGHYPWTTVSHMTMHDVT